MNIDKDDGINEVKGNVRKLAPKYTPTTYTYVPTTTTIYTPTTTTTTTTTTIKYRYVTGYFTFAYSGSYA